jgi:uncharacterized membrane protein YbaN (DUF454 family)
MWIIKFVKFSLKNPCDHRALSQVRTLSHLRNRSPLSRGVFFSLGLLCVGLGYLGLILPVMPGTIFFILALNFFRRSNAKLEHWLLYKTRMGPALQDWDENGWISKRAKTIAISLIWLSILGSCASVTRLDWSVALIAITWFGLAVTASALTWYLASRPTKPASA